MDHTVIFLWVLLSATAYTTTGLYEPSLVDIPSTAEIYTCGQAFSDPSRSFIGPSYDGGRNVIECLWTIHSNDYLPIKATLDYVDLDCDHEYIHIYNGEVHHSTLLGEVCNGSSQTFVSLTSTMSVLLHRDSYKTGPGFFAYYDIGELENTTFAGLTEIPVTVAKNTPTDIYEETTSAAIALRTHALELTSSANPEVAETTETTEIRTTPPTEPMTTSVNQCGGNLSLASGSLSGPYYPGNNVSMQCVWEIEVSPLDHIILHFSNIRLDCDKEYVEIFDGSLYSSHLLGRVCSGIYLDYGYASSSNMITILLHRDSDLSGYGFDAYYNSVQDASTTSAPPHTETTDVSTTSAPSHNESAATEESTTATAPPTEPMTTSEIGNITISPTDVSTTSALPHNESAAPATTSASVSSRSLSCSGEYMVARISRTYLQSLGFDAWEVYLNSSDSLCKPQISQDYVIFKIPFTGCGTVRQERNNGTIIYSNIIKTSASGFIITRKRNFQFHIMCEMNENTIVETVFAAQNSVDITEEHVASYSINLGFYPTSSFSYEVHSSPYYVSIDQDLYFQATLNNSDPNLVLFVDTCVASPFAHDFKTLTYDLIRSGCIRDATYRSLHSPSNNTARFTLKAFKFLNEHNEVYLQCKLVVCVANDYSSRCYQGCLSRKKRSVDEDEDKVNVVLGPFKLQGKANEDKRQELVESVNPGKNEAVSPLTVATVLLAAMVLVLSGFLLSSKLRRKSYQQIY